MKGTASIPCIKGEHGVCRKSTCPCDCHGDRNKNARPLEVHPGPEFANEIVFRLTAMGDGSVMVELGRVQVDTVVGALRVIAAGIEGGGIIPQGLN